MRKSYDVSKGKRNLYARRLEKQITIRLDEDTLEYRDAGLARTVALVSRPRLPAGR
jgi:hypothetical protein